MWSIWWLRCIGEDMISGYENSASAAASASLPASANVNNASEAIDWGSARGLDGGLHVVLGLPAPLTARAVVAALAAEGLLVAPLDDYALADRAEEEALVLGYGSASDLELTAALSTIDRTVRALLGSDAGVRGIPGG